MVIRHNPAVLWHLHATLDGVGAPTQACLALLLSASLSLPICVSLLYCRQSAVPVAQWRAADGSSTWRLDSAGLGSERPVLFRFVEEIVLQSPSRWACDVEEGPWDRSLYHKPHGAETASTGKIKWDTVVGTKIELQFIRHWLSFELHLWPDELHWSQRLVEAWRDSCVRRAVWNGQRKAGEWLFHAAWQEAAMQVAFRRNWRTYHLRLAIAVCTGPQSSLLSALPPVLGTMGRAIAQLIRYVCLFGWVSLAALGEPMVPSGT